jgi:cytochrome c oxidase subunit 1/cytochrome c oxidase subunit I+III
MALTETPKTELDEQLEQGWEDMPGVPGFLNTVDHKRIGVRYILTSFVFFFMAGAIALVMRVQLATPNSSVLGPETFNEFFTLHGTTMIFLFNTPVLAGFGNYLVPLMIGSRDMAFPRLNAFSYWVFLFAGLLFFASFVVGHAPDGGWFAYTPLTSKPYSSGINIDFWGLAVIFIGISTTVGAINFIVTIFKLRAPGMTLNRMPVFVWAMLVFSFMVIFAVPSVTVAAGLLELDRLFGTSFYTVGLGGSVLLYQHLFWFWGHPEVYILFIPATGMISMIIPVFSRRPLSGYIWVVTALVATAFISFGVWVHHMFATGIPPLALSFFSAASLLVTLPSGVQFFAWIATMWRGVVEFTTPMLFAFGFLLIFLLGGITGVMVGVLPFDWQVTDSYFVVAHFHYVLNGAVVFPIFGALYFWLPKITGKMLDERLGKISFWTMFVGFNLTFFPMHILGFLGMPRRVYTYDSGLGWDSLNLFVSVAAFLFAAGTLLTVLNVVKSLRSGVSAGNNPWHADSLEWMTSSPPREYNFAAIPAVDSRHPLWEQRPVPVASSAADDARRTLGVRGALSHEMPVTEGLDARPQDTLGIPRPTYLPFVAAIGLLLLFVGFLVTAAVIAVVGVAIGLVAVAWWVWRTEEDLR